jgi:hypothetical protein
MQSTKLSLLALTLVCSGTFLSQADACDSFPRYSCHTAKPVYHKAHATTWKTVYTYQYATYYDAYGRPVRVKQLVKKRVPIVVQHAAPAVITPVPAAAAIAIPARRTAPPALSPPPGPGPAIQPNTKPQPKPAPAAATPAPARPPAPAPIVAPQATAGTTAVPQANAPLFAPQPAPVGGRVTPSAPQLNNLQPTAAPVAGRVIDIP